MEDVLPAEWQGLQLVVEGQELQGWRVLMPVVCIKPAAVTLPALRRASKAGVWLSILAEVIL